MTLPDIVLVGGARTPFCEWSGGKRGDGEAGGLLRNVSALKLGAEAIKGALDEAGIEIPFPIRTVYMKSEAED